MVKDGSSKRKEVTLGMAHGTACARLKKNILFSILVKHEENNCFRCGSKIGSADDLSVDHIQPWEGISADLFWDLKNIAFSHKRCNVPHRYSGGRPNRKVWSKDTAWCRKHKEFLPKEEFYIDSSHWNGLAKVCKECHNSRPR